MLKCKNEKTGIYFCKYRMKYLTVISICADCFWNSRITFACFAGSICCEKRQNKLKTLVEVEKLKGAVTSLTVLELISCIKLQPSQLNIYFFISFPILISLPIQNFWKIVAPTSLPLSPQLSPSLSNICPTKVSLPLLFYVICNKT